MKHLHLPIYICLLSPMAVLAQENILKTCFLQKQVQNMSEVNDTNSQATISYYDSAGRLIQTIQKGIGPDREDMVDYIQYDEAGRKIKEYLHNSRPGNKGSFIPLDQLKMEGIRWTKDYRYEPSAEGRLLEASGLHVGDKSVSYKYRLNNYNEPKLRAYEFIMQDNTSLNKHDAVAGAYQVTEETDEDEHLTLLFTDSDGRTVLKRRIDGDTFYDTYSVYDSYDRLRCVLPPEAADACTTMDELKLKEGNALDLYAYLYTYDDHNRRIGVKYPGADWIYTVYDGDGRPILTQDGNQRKRKEWSFFKYDGLGRNIMEGVVADRRNREELAAIYGDVLVREEYIGTGEESGGYSDHVKLGQGNYVLTYVRYYDDYSFRETGNKWPDMTSTPAVSAKGLLTGTFEAILNLPGKGRYTINLYDEKERLIQQTSKETMSGNIVNTTNQYDFTGAITDSRTTYGELFTMGMEYSYDHAEREKESVYWTEYKGIQNKRTLRSIKYGNDCLITEKQLMNSKATVTYTHHGNGTLYYITSSTGFGELIYASCHRFMLPYRLPTYYNGNISDFSIQQDNDLYFYHLEYDNLDRLTTALMYQKNGDRMRNYEKFSYDKMGNITWISRLNETGDINNLDIHYKGNHLLKVTDAVHRHLDDYNLATYPDLVDKEQEYYYDSNGNQTANLDKNIVATRYNLLNLPDTVQFANGNRIVNYYLAGGEKLGSVSRTYTTPLSVPLDKVTDSTDPYVETKEWRSRNLHFKNGIAEKIDIEEGYLQIETEKTTGNLKSFKPYAYICDHLGSVRQVFDVTENQVVQRLDYYPSGLIFRSTNYDLQPNKYTGKELISMHGLNQYDSYARMQEFQIPHFTTMDPLCEKYYDLSPYGYCANNPMRYVDLKGDSVRVYTETQAAGHSWISVGEGDDMVVYSYGRYNGTNKGPDGSSNTLANGPGVLLKLTGEEAKAYNEKKAAGGMSVFVIADVTDENVAGMLDEKFDSSTIMPDNPKSTYYNDPSAHVVDEYNLVDNNCTTVVSDVLNNNGSTALKGTMFQQTSSFGTWTTVPITNRFVLPVLMQNYLTKVSKSGDVVRKAR